MCRHIVLAFHNWMIKECWHLHSSGEYYYQNKRDFLAWPPEATATEDELLNMFFGK